MHLIQILLPLTAGISIDRSLFNGIKHELPERFGGITAYTRSPAEGLWQNEAQEVEDDIGILK